MNREHDEHMTGNTPAGAPRAVLELDMSLGESPVWDVDRQRLHWVDINRGLVYTWHPDSKASPITMSLGEAVGCIALRDKGLVAATASGIFLLEPELGEKTRIAENPEWRQGAGNRFNDGRCDAQGRLWVGTIDADESATSAALYCLVGNKLACRKPGIAISNGLAFSPDRRWLYHTDSPTRRILRHRYDPLSGEIDAGEVWVDLDEFGLPGVPDGAAIDSAGHYWCALYDGAQIARFDPEGHWLESHTVPCPHPTMVAFGGADLKTLYITTATQHLSEEDKQHKWPLAGSLFAMSAPVPGLAEPIYTA